MKRTLSVAARVAMVVAVAMGWTTPTSAAEAASITKVGWWTSNPAAQAPDDGINVSNGPNGAVSVGAVEVAASTGLSRAVLILPEEGGIQTDSAKLAVCPTPNDWDAGGAQDMAAAPKAECDGGKVELTRNASSSTWAADVSSLVGDIEDEGTVSLMVVPSGAATVPVGFEVRFQKPQITAEAAADSGSLSGSSSSFDAGAFGSGSTGSSSDTSSSTGGGFSSTSGNSSSDSSNFAPTFDASATAAPVAPNTADGAAGAPPATDGAAASADTTATTAPAELAALPTQAALGVSTGDGNATVQALFFVVIASMAGVGAGAGRWYFRTRRPDAGAFV